MKRPDLRTAYSDFSASTSEKVRQLSFAALGIVWVFRPPLDFRLPTILVLAGGCAVLALALDFLQSLYGTLAWGILHRRKELAGLGDEQEFKAPRQINWPTNALFAAKVAALVGCYVLLLRHLARLVQ